jgi:hypothetical protein
VVIGKLVGSCLNDLTGFSSCVIAGSSLRVYNGQHAADYYFGLNERKSLDSAAGDQRLILGYTVKLPQSYNY